MHALQRIIYSYSLHSVSVTGPRRAGATVGRLPLPILHRSLCYTRSLGAVFSREIGVLPPGSARPAGRADSGAAAAPSPSTYEKATPAEKVLWPAAAG